MYQQKAAPRTTRILKPFDGEPIAARPHISTRHFTEPSEPLEYENKRPVCRRACVALLIYLRVDRIKYRRPLLSGSYRATASNNEQTPAAQPRVLHLQRVRL